MENEPMKINIRAEKSLFIITSIPIIMEIKRTMVKSFTGEEFDFTYYHEAATEKPLDYIKKGRELF